MLQRYNNVAFSLRVRARASAATKSRRLLARGPWKPKELKEINPLFVAPRSRVTRQFFKLTGHLAQEQFLTPSHLHRHQRPPAPPRRPRATPRRRGRGASGESPPRASGRSRPGETRTTRGTRTPARPRQTPRRARSLCASFLCGLRCARSPHGRVHQKKKGRVNGKRHCGIGSNWVREEGR